MCGIFGFQVKSGEELSTYEATLISLSLGKDMESRGRDSFGGVSVVGDVAKTTRGLGRITENGSKLFRLASESRSFLAHTRAATVGAVNEANAHPFFIDGVLGVHNGSVRNWSELNKKYDRKFEVDSQQVFAHIAAGLSVEELEAYGVFFWTKQAEKWTKIYMAKTMAGNITIAKFHRNREAKPKDDDHFMIAWASEYDAIKKIASLLDVQYHTVGITTEKVHFIENGTIFETSEVFKTAVSNTNSYTCNGDNSCRNVSHTHYGQGPYGNNSRTGYFVDAVWDNNRNIWVSKHMASTAADADDATDDDTTMITESFGHNKTLSRRERKALRRTQEYWRKKNWEWAADPIEANVHSGNNLPKVFKKLKPSDEKAETHYICSQCNCLLILHTWTTCSENKYSFCKVPRNQSCDSNGVSCCNDCGHYLVEGVHEVNNPWGIVSCIACNNNYCAPEATTREEVIARAQEIAEENENPDKPASTLLLTDGITNLLNQVTAEDTDEELSNRVSLL